MGQTESSPPSEAENLLAEEADERKHFSGASPSPKNAMTLSSYSSPISVPPSIPYRVIYKGGIRVRSNPHLAADANADTFDYLDVVYTLPGSELSTPQGQLLKLKDNQGWVFTKFGNLTILEEYDPENESIESAASSIASDFPCWYTVTDETGVMVLEEPSPSSASLLEVFLEGKIIEISEKIRTPLENYNGKMISTHLFLKLHDRDGFVCAESYDQVLCKKCASPVCEVGQWWVQITYGGGVLIRAEPKLRMVVTKDCIPCGSVIHVSQRYCSAGNGDVFLAVSACNVVNENVDRYDFVGGNDSEEILGWIPVKSGNMPVISYCSKPIVRQGSYVFQNKMSSELPIQKGPHFNSPRTKTFIQPYSVFKVAKILTLSSESETSTYVQLEGEVGWVICAAAQNKYLVRLAEFPVVTSEACIISISAEGDVYPRRGPCFQAPAIKDLAYTSDDELTAVVRWYVAPIDPQSLADEANISGVDLIYDVRWALVEDVGWFCVHNGGLSGKSEAIILKDLASVDEELINS